MKRTNTAKWMEVQKRWQINVQKEGMRRSFYSSTLGRTGQRECNAKADAWLDENIDKTNLRINILYADFIDSLKLTTSKSNWLKIESFGKNWILDEIGNFKISNLTEQHLQNIVNKAFAAGLAKKTLLNLRASLVSFLKYCRKRKVTTLLPEDITVPKGAKVSIKRILQPDDLTKLFTFSTTMLYGKLAEDIYINAYRFQVLTGLRPGELIGLKWSDIINDMVYINRAVNAYGETTSGKNENAIRHFALSKLSKQVLSEQRILCEEHSECIFKIVSLSSYQKKWKHYCESNDIIPISPYEMRHTFISIAKNLSEGQIKPLIGHSRNMDTFGTYGHEVNCELENTANKLNDIFGEILQSVL